MHDRHHDDNDGDQDFLSQGNLQRVKGFVDQAGTIIKRDDGNLADSTICKSF